MFTASKVLANSETVEEKLNTLAERFCDAWEWRAEESRLLDNYNQQLQELRERVESVASAQEATQI